MELNLIQTRPVVGYSFANTLESENLKVYNPDYITMHDGIIKPAESINTSGMPQTNKTINQTSNKIQFKPLFFNTLANHRPAIPAPTITKSVLIVLISAIFIHSLQIYGLCL